MFYMLIIHGDESIWMNHSEAEQAATMAEHEALQRHLEKADQYRGCGGLAPSSAATTLRRKNGKTFVTDGPYAEAKEQFGGYYIVEVDDLDEAIAAAERIPAKADNSVEIRPILDFRR